MTGLRVVGIDPGLTGAAALLHEGGLDVADLPVLDHEVDGWQLTALLAGWGQVDLVVLERVSARPGQGVSSSFGFGAGYGVILGVVSCMQRPLRRVTPAVWTRTLAVGADKDRHRAEACRRWPDQAALFSRKKDDGRADAALLAEWGRQTLVAERGAA